MFYLISSLVFVRLLVGKFCNCNDWAGSDAVGMCLAVVYVFSAFDVSDDVGLDAFL